MDRTALPLEGRSGASAWKWGVAVFVVSVLVYFPVFGAGFIWDDPDYIINNKNLRDVAGLVRTWAHPLSLPQWYPVVHSTFWLEYQLWRLWAPGYHAVNVVLHAAGAVALMWGLVRVGLPVRVACLGALVWSVHPVQVESVAWVTERKNTLSALFYFLSMGLLCCWEDRRGQKGGLGFWVGAFGCFVLALGSKTVTASLPAAWLLVRYWRAGRVDWKRDVWPMVPFLVVGFAAGQVTAWLERNHVGAAGLEWNFTKADRVLIAGRAVWFYLEKLALPVRLAFIYERWTLDPGAVWQWGFPVAAVGLGVGLFWMRRRVGRGPFVGYAFFVGTLFPALGFFNVYPFRYSFVADHFQHIASVGPLVLLSVWVVRWPKVAVGALVGVLGVLTVVQSHVYRDSMTLWTDTVAKSPRSWMAHTNLAMVYRDRAREETNLGVKRNDEEVVLREVELARDLAPGVAEAQWVLGVAYVQRRELEKARGCFEAAIRIDPSYVPSLNSLGDLEMRAGRVEEAERLFRDALRQQPGFLAARSNLAELLAKEGKREEAAREYAAVVNIDPTRAEDRLALARLLMAWGKETGDREKLTYAASHFNEALKLKPADAQLRLEFGETLLLLGEREKGAALVKSAAKLDPGLAPDVEGVLR